ncbi:transposable element Tcb1 transposase [Trichonephila clavipes]|nr:transposable element Tcb1 transposase [Trichonephila clavipes]
MAFKILLYQGAVTVALMNKTLIILQLDIAHQTVIQLVCGLDGEKRKKWDDKKRVENREGSLGYPGILLTANHRRLRLQWAHEPRAWQADWHQGVFSDESRLNLWDNDCRIHVIHYAGKRCLPEGVIERHSGLTPRVIVWGDISYPGRSNLLRIEGNLNSNRYVREVLSLQRKVVPFL